MYVLFVLPRASVARTRKVTVPAGPPVLRVTVARWAPVESFVILTVQLDLPGWLVRRLTLVDRASALTAKVSGLPDIDAVPFPVELPLVVEFYS